MAKREDDPNRLIRERAGRYRTQDGRFSVEAEASGAWYVVDAEQHDELGMPRVSGPHATLGDAREVIVKARAAPPVVSHLAARAASGTSQSTRRGERRGERPATKPAEEEPSREPEPEPTPMRIAVYGAGGVGGYFGGRLARGAGADVHLIARGAHLAALRRRGLTVKSVGGDFQLRLPATDDVAQVGPVDVVLVCVKSYDTATVAGRLTPLLHERTAVLSLQNGIDNEEILADAVEPERVMGGVAFIFTAVAEPAVVRHTGGPGRVVFGELDGRRSERAEALLELCQRAGVPAEISDDIRVELWSKFAFICAQAGMTAAVRLPLGEIRETPESWAMFERIVREVWTLARAEGVALPDDLVERHLAFAGGLEPDSFSSLHHDLTTGHRMELEALHGTVVRRAEQCGVPVPACEAVYSILRPWARRNERAQEQA